MSIDTNAAPATKALDTNLILRSVVGLGALLTIVWLALNAAGTTGHFGDESDTEFGAYFDGTTWQWMIIIVIAALTIAVVAASFALAQRARQMNLITAGFGVLTGIAGIVAFIVAPGLARSSVIDELAPAAPLLGFEVETWEQAEVALMQLTGADRVSITLGIGAWLMLITGILMILISGFWLFSQKAAKSATA